MTLLLLGVGSGLCWGVADFFGGLQSRRLPALAVALWSQMAGGLALVLVLLAQGGGLVPQSALWALAAGVCGGLGLLLFYRGLAVGIMSIVAPVAACGALVPVVVGFVLGQVPSSLALLGIVVAVAGIVLVSLQPQQGGPTHGNARLSLVLALGAALNFGFFFVFLERGAAVTGASPLWVIGAARVGSLLTLLLIIVTGPRRVPAPGAAWLKIAAVGVLDTLANALYTYATTHGKLGIVAVLGSLYPVATVLLGRLILAERLTPPQWGGVVLALTGVALLAAG